jgi:hypothetical protein
MVIEEFFDQLTVERIILSSSSLAIPMASTFEGRAKPMDSLTS